MKLTDFQSAVLRVVRVIPAGKVVSYGQVAAYIRAPRAARQVGWAMRSMGEEPDFPWWRVLNNAGHITIKGAAFNAAGLQKELLEKEGINVSRDFTLDMSRHRFRASAELLHSWRLDPDYIETVLAKYDVH